jgi:glycosyltransferase involved in cell wall biosynthesis
MRVAVVTARPPAGDDPRSRHASGVAAGLRRAGLDVEHLAADHAVAPRLWEAVRHRAAAFDIVHVVGIRALPAVFAAHGRARGIVVSPQDDQGPVSMLRRLLNRPSGPASRALLEMADRIVCSTEAETQRLGRIVPAAFERMRVVPLGVDTAAIRRAQPLPGAAEVLLALSGPGRGHRIARSIAALADLGPSFELVVAGPCASAQGLAAEARQLGVAGRVRFLGRVDDATLHRWLRTARVVVALSERWTSPQVVLAALAAGTPVVLSEVAPHLDAVRRAGDAGVTFVTRDVSPLALADAISASANLRLSPTASPGLPTVDDEIAGLLEVYGELVRLPARDTTAAPARARPGAAGRRAS